MKYKSGFEFYLNGREAMVWDGRYSDSNGWVYIVVTGWTEFQVMTEVELDNLLNL